MRQAARCRSISFLRAFEPQTHRRHRGSEKPWIGSTIFRDRAFVVSMTRLPILILLLVPATALAEDESPPLSIYGFARLDVLADDSRMSDINQPMYVTREPASGELNMTPRLAQIGTGIGRGDS